MFKFYGYSPPDFVHRIEVGGHCPHCNAGTKFIRTTDPQPGTLAHNKVCEVVVDYVCSICRKPIPIKWRVRGIDGKNVKVDSPKAVLPMREPFDFEHVPDSVREEIEEALDCLSVNAFNGFAAVCRRSIQVICTDLGADATTRVKNQIEDMMRITGLEDDWKELAFQIMLSGHDGAHPHLPEMTSDRASVLLSLLQDLTYQIYTRPGKVREAASLRKEAIEDRKDSEP